MYLKAYLLTDTVYVPQITLSSKENNWENKVAGVLQNSTDNCRLLRNSALFLYKFPGFIFALVPMPGPCVLHLTINSCEKESSLTFLGIYALHSAWYETDSKN